MQFLRLRLNGFKSFVDPTDLMISPGLTGVVGPNGCGKSNLLEALRWVMGENRPTVMRGEGMEDIIFSGTTTRPARNFSEVVLDIDNQERQASAMFNASARIEVVRRLTRELGSSYKVNGNDTRARDVQMLFADAAIGAHSPSLVRQGQITELINARPKMRRLILEQAAGISGLHQRRHEAELKLKASENNLERVDDVLKSLASQLASLERQAQQAVRYRKIGEKLRMAESQLFYRRWLDGVAKVEEETANFNACVRAFGEAEAQRSKAARRHNEANTALAPLREAQAGAHAGLQRIMVEQSALEGEIERAEEAISRLTEQAEQIARDMAREKQLSEDAKTNAEALIAERELSYAREQKDEALFKTLEKQVNDALEEVTAKGQKAAEQSEMTARLAAHYERAQNLVDGHTKSLKASEDGLALSQKTHAQARLERQNATELLAEKERALSAAQTIAQTSESALLAAEKARTEMQASEKAGRTDLASAESAETALIGECETLEKLIAQNVENTQSPLWQMKVEPGFEAALAAALGEDLNAPLSEAPRASGWHALDGASVASKAQTLPAQATPLSTYIKFPKALSSRMNQIGLVGDAKVGFELQSQLKLGQRLVSKAGDLWRWDGYVSLAAEKPNAAAFRLQQINRHAEVKQQCQKASAESQKIHAEYEVRKTALDDASTIETQARQHWQNASEKLNSANRDYTRAEAEISRWQGNEEDFESKIARQREEFDATKHALKEAKGALDALPSLEAARKEANDMRDAHERMQADMLEKTRDFEALKQAIDARARRLKEIDILHQSWMERLEAAQKRMGDMQNRRAELLQTLEGAKTQPKALSERREALERELEKSKQAEAQASAALRAGETEMREADSLERQANKQASEAGEARARAETKAEVARETTDQIAEHIMQTYQKTPEALAENLGIDGKALDDSETLEVQVSRLLRQRDALGAINLRAEDDARDIRTEHDRLAHEKEELEAAIAKLRIAITNLNREGRQRMIKAFDAVNANFEKLFVTLFNGGAGRLEMVESDDPLEAGLEILCQPPGKKLASLSLLSGGEQTLTALALIFAVFLVTPSPICVLDEVDAPLDDLNIIRFCDLLDKLCDQTTTRFLIITHHPITMARMDRLYGVTMAEKGVSQLVSVDLQKAEKMVS